MWFYYNIQLLQQSDLILLLYFCGTNWVTKSSINNEYCMEASMKSKVFLLIFLVVILSSCSFQTDKASDKNDLENIEGLNDEDTDEELNNGITEEELNSKENHADILDRIINDIKNKSEIYKDIKLADIKKIQDTYYVVVKVNEAEMTDHDFMLWKYDMSPELLLIGNAIDILSMDNYYFVSYRESLKYGTKYTITKYDHYDENYEKVIYEGGFSKFTFSPNNDYMYIQNDNEVIILDKDYEILFKNKLYNNAENIEDGHYVDMQFISWTKDNKKLWVATGYHAYVMTFHLIDIENSTQDTFFTGESYGITEIALNPDNNCIAYSTKPEFYESSAYDEFHANQTIVYLYFFNLVTNEKIEISKSVTRGFRPKWVSNKIFEYNDPDGFMRLTFNIDDYHLNSGKENPENEENLWQYVEGITPFVNNKDGNWYYNETTYKIALKIPSIYHLDSPGVYFYWREDGKGCYISLTNYIYELDKNTSFVENVKNIYFLNNSYINENIFDNVIIEEGITDNGYKYAYFADDITDYSNDRVLSYIFVQLDDYAICRLDYALFSEDFGKFDADVIINSITHTLTEGLFREEFLTVYTDDAVNQVNFKVPYFYIQNYHGEYYYETSEKEDSFYPLDYFIDNKEEITLYIQDTETEIEYMGEITEGYTKNRYKYSYYVEKETESYQPYGTEKWEEVTRFITNISVRLDKYSVLKMKYELSEEDFSLFDVNEILDSVQLK